MPLRNIHMALAVGLTVWTCGAALGQRAVPGSVFDPAQLPEMRGTVKRYTLTPAGDIDGLVLADGTEVNLPPHLTPEIAFAIRPGDAVTIHGLRARALPLVAATSIRNDRSGQSIVDRGPRRGGRGGEEQTRTGLVEFVLHGPRGEVNGLMLDDGTTVRLPPDDVARLSSGGTALAAGQRVTVRGALLDTVFGSVLDASAIGREDGALSEIRRPPDGGPDRRPPPPERRRP